MPSRNTQKDYLEDAYYHVYNRGVNKREIFIDEEDYSVFLNLFKRYLSDAPVKDLKGREYPWLKDQVEMLAYCLMPNHFHLLLYQSDMYAMKHLMHGVLTAYTGYFNKKYKRVGPLFQARYKASHIVTDSYLLHITRYIHLNPDDYQKWEFSSLQYYLGKKNADWVSPQKMLDMFDNKREYSTFIKDHRDYKDTIDQLEHMLANN